MYMSALTSWLGQMMPSQTAQDPSIMRALLPGQGAQGTKAAEIHDEKKDEAFPGLLAKAAESMLGPQGAAQEVVQQFGRGAEGEVHQSMMALEKADISFKFIMTAKNKALEAYKEITRMG